MSAQLCRQSTPVRRLLVSSQGRTISINRPGPGRGGQLDQDVRRQESMMERQLKSMAASSKTKRQQQQRTTSLDQLENLQKARDLEQQMSRTWKSGDVYSPRDLGWYENRKWKGKSRPQKDVFDALAVNPLDEYKNFSIMSEYMSSMGRIKHSKETGLRPVNQRRMAKAIRRSIGMGLMPSSYHHPEILSIGLRNRAFAQKFK